MKNFHFEPGLIIATRKPTFHAMSKREFLLQYVLNRAATSAGLSGSGAAQEAIKAWDVIEGAK